MYNFSARSELEHVRMKPLVIPTTDLKNRLEELDIRDFSLAFVVSVKPFINTDQDDLQCCNAHLTDEQITHKAVGDTDGD